MTNSLLTAGTATATNGSATVTGSGTVWASTVRPGMLIAFGSPYSDWYQVTAVASDTSLTIHTNYTGTTGSYGYGILPWFATEADAATRVSNDLLTLLEGYGTIFNVSGASKTQEFNKTLSGGDAGQILSQGGTKQFRFGLFGDNVYRLQRTTDGTNWTTVYSVDKSTGAVTVAGTWTMPAVVLTDVNTGPVGGLRNLLLNGSMDIWQRGTSGTSGYVADRWFVGNTTSITRSTDVPDARFLYSIEIANTSAAQPYISQKIEASNCRHLVGKKVRVSFWAKNISGSSTLVCDLTYANSVDNFSGITAIASATASASPSSSWTLYSVDLGTMPSGAANGLYMFIARGNASASTTRITGVQLEIGDVATNYEFVGERGGIAAELARCKWYFERIGGVASITFSNASGVNTTLAYSALRYETKRVNPTISFSTASQFQLTGNGTDVALTSISLDQVAKTSTALVRLNVASGLTGSASYVLLNVSGQTPYIDISAEL